MPNRFARGMAVIIVLVALLVPQSASVGAATKPPRKVSPPGQIQIATVNAKQNKILGLNRIIALIELTKALRFRPPAFNSGKARTVLAPDIAVISEFRPTNVEVLTRLMRLKFDQPYEIVGPSDVQAALIVNTATLALEGEVELITDVCRNDPSSDKPRFHREYPMARFTEVSTGAAFTVIGVHLARDYNMNGQSNCLVRNIEQLRAAVANEPGAAFMAGDFNFRPTQTPYECDAGETSPPAAWWAAITQPQDGGRAFVDAVRQFQTEQRGSMRDHWTYQHPRPAITCNGTTGIRRSRIDYIFASDAAVAEGWTDHPGWTAPDTFNYSDHRYALGRFVLTGPDRPRRVVVTPDAGGIMHLAWEPVEGTTQWVLFRAEAGSKYVEIARLPAETLAFDDSTTIHDTRYRYSLAGIGDNGGQGREAAGAWATADARGPRVSSITPARGATNVGVNVRIRATFDEFVVADSVGDNTITLFRNGRPVRGRVVRKGGFVITFDPAQPLRRNENYTILVQRVADVLGNRGPSFTARFSTVGREGRRDGQR